MGVERAGATRTHGKLLGTNLCHIYPREMPRAGRVKPNKTESCLPTGDPAR